MWSSLPIFKNPLVTISAYLVACGVAWTLHEAAHYSVHRLYAESITVGLSWSGPYVHAVYGPSAPTVAIRLGSIAPTLLYTPLLSIAITLYRESYSIPALSPVEWTYIVIPILILVTPSISDLRHYLAAYPES